MTTNLDLDLILAPIPGENPAGEDLRYTVHDEIKEAKRADDTFDRGDWDRDLKKADWDKTVKLCVEALSKKTKDLQIAIWLTEALTVTEGFKGSLNGLKIITGYLRDHWDHVYPRIDEDDFEYRILCLEYLNNSLSTQINHVSLTDNKAKAGHSWFKYKESRKVGYETDAQKKTMRDELAAEGKLTAEEFDAAVGASSKAFYVALAEALDGCMQEFKQLDEIVDEKFGKEAPRLAELKTALEGCDQVVKPILKEKRELEPDPEPEDASDTEETSQEGTNLEEGAGLEESQQEIIADSFPEGGPGDSASQEGALWQKAVAVLSTSGVNKALSQLLYASSSAPSVREKNRYRLLMVKLCLKANRPDLARPIVEELNALIEELNLERWESSRWIAEVLAALYQCLTTGEATAEDTGKAQVLFQKLCTLDVTKAMIYKH